VPAPTAAGTGLRAGGRLLLSAHVAQPGETKQLLALMAQLSALTDTVTRLKEAQDRAGQAGAARQAAPGAASCYGPLRRSWRAAGRRCDAGAGLKRSGYPGC